MNIIAWLLGFWLMPIWAFTVLFLKLYFTLIFNVLKFAGKIVLLLVNCVKMSFIYMIRKVKEYKQ